MRKVHILGPVVVAMFALGAVAATPAAAVEWVVDGHSVTEAEKTHVEATGTLHLADLKTGITLTCTGSESGIVYGSFALIEGSVETSCTVEGSCGTPLFVAQNLPWLLELNAAGNEVLLTEDGAGAPAWGVLCFGVLEDLCEASDSNQSVENMPAKADVLEDFFEGSNAKCSVGGANSGEVKGELLIVASEGLSLEVGEPWAGKPAPAEWLVDGSSVTEAEKSHVEVTGTLSLVDLKSGVTLTCEGGGLGIVYGSFGLIEEATATSCTAEGTCGTPLAVAQDLPWLAELNAAGTEVLLTEDGVGAPAWGVLCFGVLEDLCEAVDSDQRLENMLGESPGDVLADFFEGSAATCKLGGASSGEVKGELLVAALEGLSLEVGEPTTKEWLVDGSSVTEAEKSHVEVTGTLSLVDIKTGVTLTCEGGGLGIVYGSFGLIEEATATSCTAEGTCGTPLAVAQDLPWLTVLDAAGTQVLLTEDGAGPPAWGVLCFGFLEDLCDAVNSNQRLENMLGESPGDVLADFFEGSAATCKLGGTSSGEVKGEILIAALEGLSLEVT